MGRTKSNEEINKALNEKRRRSEIFKRIYDKPKSWEPLKIEDINMEKHFYIMDQFIQWPDIPLSAIAIYPCLSSLANYHNSNWFQISEENLAKMSGLSKKTLISGIEFLLNGKFFIKKGEGYSLVNREFKNEGKRRFYVYNIPFVTNEININWNEKFIFHTALIESGLWAELSPRAKALYLAIRSSAKFDKDSYTVIEDVLTDDEFFRNEFKFRKWELCELPLSQLCKMVGGGFDNTKYIGGGISTSDIHKTVKELELVGLLEKYDFRYIVYFKPKKFSLITH